MRQILKDQGEPRCTCSLQDIADTVPDELHEEECERAQAARFTRLVEKHCKGDY